MTIKSLSLAPDYPPGEAPVVPPELKPPAESPDIGFAASQADETFAPDLQRAPVTLPSGSEPLAIESDRLDIKVESRKPSSAVCINRTFMGYQTDLYGKLEFTRTLNTFELAALKWVIGFFRENGERVYEKYLRELGKSGRAWDNDLDNQNIQKACDDAPRDAGFVRIEDRGYAGDMTVEKDGLVYASEESYDLVRGINYIIANARQLMPDFSLREQLYAETEFEPYQWL